MTRSSVQNLFTTRFGGHPTHVAIAPGRVNLIGEHTDYNDGFVFPAAIDRSLIVAARAIDGETSSISSAQQGDGVPFSTLNVEPGRVSGWTAYPAGMAWALRELGAKSQIEAMVDSDIPMGSGVSSSAAVEMAFGVIWRTIDRLEIDAPTLAKRGQVCENQFVGVSSGIMDQMASACGRAAHAMFLDTRTLEIQYAPIPDSLVIVLCDTRTPRTLAGSAYNVRRAQCESACETLGVAKLRDVTIEQVEAARSTMSEIVYRRAKHVVTENNRCVEFKQALEVGDLVRVGELMRGSHESLRDDYEVSCRELDAMAEAAWLAPGCVGARMTGAGFGGACVAIVRRESAEMFVKSTLKSFESRIGRAGDAMVCSVVDGARLASLGPNT